MAHDPRHRHVGGGNCVHRANDIAFDAGQLHQSRHRVADKTLQVGQRHGKGLGTGLGGAASQVHQRCRGHGTGRAHLRLTAAFRTGQRGPCGHHLPKARRHIQRPAHRVLITGSGPVQRQQHRGQHPAAARRGRRHNAFHAGVALGGFQCLRHDLAQIAAAQQHAVGSRRLHFGCVTARKTAHGAVAGPVIRTGLAHHRPQTAHLRLRRGAAQAALRQIALQNHLVQRFAVGFAGVQHFPHRCV